MKVLVSGLVILNLPGILGRLQCLQQIVSKAFDVVYTFYNIDNLIFLTQPIRRDYLETENSIGVQSPEGIKLAQ